MLINVRTALNNERKRMSGINTMRERRTHRERKKKTEKKEEDKIIKRQNQEINEGEKKKAHKEKH